MTFLGKQGDLIAFVADTREELENLPCVTLTEIVETDVNYILYNGTYITEDEFNKLDSADNNKTI